MVKKWQETAECNKSTFVYLRTHTQQLQNDSSTLPSTVFSHLTAEAVLTCASVLSCNNRKWKIAYQNTKSILCQYNRNSWHKSCRLNTVTGKKKCYLLVIAGKIRLQLTKCMLRLLIASSWETSFANVKCKLLKSRVISVIQVSCLQLHIGW